MNYEQFFKLTVEIDQKSRAIDEQLRDFMAMILPTFDDYESDLRSAMRDDGFSEFKKLVKLYEERSRLEVLRRVV
jgi:hypothetical protein